MYTFTREEEGDTIEVEWLYDLAFAPGRHALSSYKLRQNIDPVADLSVVARDSQGVLAGAIRYWPVRLGTAGHPALLLGPVAVHPTRQGEGLGAMLIFDTVERATAAQWERIILVGDEPYYSRFGFTRKTAAALEFPPPTNRDRLLARALRSGAFDKVSGMVRRWR